MAAPTGKGYSGEAVRRIRGVGERLVEVFIDVEGVEGRIEGCIGRTEAQTLFGGRQQRFEVRDIRLVERLSELGEHELAPVGHFGGDDAGGITPIELADGDGLGGAWVVGGCGRFVGARCPPVMAAFAAQFAVGVAGRLLGLSVTVADVGLGVVLFDPCDDVLGIDGDAFAEAHATGGQFSLEQGDAAGE